MIQEMQNKHKLVKIEDHRINLNFQSRVVFLLEVGICYLSLTALDL